MTRLVEPPLGADADERPGREEVAELWAQAAAKPVPDYDAITLRELFLGRRA